MGLLPCLAWLLALGVLLLEGLPAGGRSALVLALFVAAAGTPPAPNGPAPTGPAPPGALGRAQLLLALALGPLALAAVQDRQAGAGDAVLIGLLPGLLCLGLLAAAAARPGRVYGVLWIVLGIVAPLHGQVLGPGLPLVDAGPLAWSLERAARPRGPGAADLAPVLVALVLASLARVGRPPGPQGKERP